MTMAKPLRTNTTAISASPRICEGLAKSSLVDYMAWSDGDSDIRITISQIGESNVGSNDETKAENTVSNSQYGPM